MKKKRRKRRKEEKVTPVKGVIAPVNVNNINGLVSRKHFKQMDGKNRTKPSIHRTTTEKYAKTISPPSSTHDEHN